MAPTPPTTSASDSFRIEISNRTKYDISLSLPSLSIVAAGSQARSFQLNSNLVSKRNLTLNINIGNHDEKSNTTSNAGQISIRVLNSTTSSSVAPETSTTQDPSLIDYLPLQLPQSISSKLWAIQSLPSINSNSPILIHFFPLRSLSNFLSFLPSSLPISTISLPGTHESLARYGFPISSCQSMLSEVTYQLNNGIRYFDVRMVPKGQGQDAKLFAYHGITDERITLDEVLKQCYDWLDGEGKNEFIMMSLKQESGPNPPVFDNLLASRYINPNLNKYWFLSGKTIPTLSQVRGKIILFSRFGTSNQTTFGSDPNLEIGLHASKWPNSFKGNFTFNLPDNKTSCQIQDWYSISNLSSIPDKFNLIKELISEGNAGYQRNVLGINYCNGSDFPFASPPFVAKGLLSKSGIKCLRIRGVNEYLGGELLERLRLKSIDQDGDEKSKLKLKIDQDSNLEKKKESESKTGNQWFNWNKEKSDKVTTQTTGNLNDINPVAESYGLMTIFALDFFDEPKGCSAEYLTRLIVEANFEPGSD